MTDLSRLSPAEYEILQCLWEYGDLPAGRVADHLRARRGWHINTTYTIIHKCVTKGFVLRTEPKFHCHPSITKDQVRQYAVRVIAELLYDGDCTRLTADLPRMFTPQN